MLGDGLGDAGPALHRSALHRSALSRSAPCRPGVAAVVHRARSTQSPAADNVCNTPRFPHPTANAAAPTRSEEHTSELQSLMRISYAVFCLKTTKAYTTLQPEEYANNITHDDTLR